MLPEAEPIFVAWAALSTSRPVTGFGLSPIPFLAIDQYAHRYGPDDLDGFDFFQRAIRALDAAFIAHNATPAQGGS